MAFSNVENDLYTFTNIFKYKTESAVCDDKK